jgi:hypothetical protein
MKVNDDLITKYLEMDYNNPSRGMFIDRKVWTRGISRQKVVQAKGWSYTWIGRMGRRSDKWTSTVFDLWASSREEVVKSAWASLIRIYFLNMFIENVTHHLKNNVPLLYWVYTIRLPKWLFYLILLRPKRDYTFRVYNKTKRGRDEGETTPC